MIFDIETVPIEKLDDVETPEFKKWFSDNGSVEK